MEEGDAGDNDSCESNHGKYVSDCHIVNTQSINVKSNVTDENENPWTVTDLRTPWTSVLRKQ